MSAEDNPTYREMMIAEHANSWHTELVNGFMQGMNGDHDMAMIYAFRTPNGVVVRTEKFVQHLSVVLTSPAVLEEIMCACRVRDPENKSRFLEKFKKVAAVCYADMYAGLLAEAAVDEAIRDQKRGAA